MARKSASDTAKEVKELKKVNKQLQAENQQLKQKVSAGSKAGPKGPGWFSRTWRSIAIFILIALAGAVLVAGNLLFWAGHTIVDSQAYENTIAPLVKNSDVQSAVALYTTNQIFDNNDVPAVVQSVLPPRADFLAPQLSSQLKTLTQTTLTKAVQNEKFQTAWVNVNVKAHDSLLALANSPGGQDGVIDINDLYQQLSNNLSDTKLSFLAGKSLPPKVGDITVLKSNKLHTLHVVSANINTFKYASLALVVIFTGLAVWLSRNRRRVVVLSTLLFTILMLLSLVSYRLLISIISSKAQSEYQAGVSAAAGIILHPLQVQTWIVLLVAMFASLAAWLSGPYKSATMVRGRTQMLLDGKVHQAVFSKENGLTLWFGSNKRVLQWTAVGLVVLAMLLVHLTPAAVVISALIALVLVGLVEILAAPAKAAR